MGGAFEHLVTVRWRDADALGHVNHAVFLTYLEEARDAFWAQAFGGEPMYVVARIEIDYKVEVRYTEPQVSVRVEVERLGRTSLVTRETVLGPQQTVAAQARTTSVRWDPDGRRSMAFTDAERAALAAFQGS